MTRLSCLPNVLIDDWRVGGQVDLAPGVANRWSDLAVATWSVTWNLAPGWEASLLDAVGVERDTGTIAFWLLYDLVP
jgi:kanamycin kinase